jgi:hypothetical protein
MKKQFLPLLYTLLALLVLTGYHCQKNPNTPDVPAPADPLQEKVTASVAGRVTDENGKPVSNAAIKAGSGTTTTDINGSFRLNNVQLTKNAGFVQVEKTGYFKTGRTLFATAGALHSVEIQLIPKTEKGTFTAASGGVVNVDAGSAVNFPVSAVVNTATNTPYTGTVKVYGAYLHPDDPELLAIMPGSLTGITTTNELKVLQTYGMIAIELEGSNGEKLNIAAGKTATLTMPIASTQLAAAPATMPLWHFDETIGTWKEEGSVTKQGNNYVGTVSHFSFWNCDVPSNFINLRLSLQNQQQQVLRGYRVELRNTVTNAIANGYTDSAGTVTGAVPINAALEMRVINKCGTTVHTQNIGPFATATDMGVITITTPVAATVTLTGTATKCNLEPVNNGFVDVYLEGLSYRGTITNGAYSISINRCSNTAATAEVFAVDLDASQYGNKFNVAVNAGAVTVPTIAACGTSIEEFIRYTIGAQQVYFIPGADSLMAYRNGTVSNISANHLQQDSAVYQYTAFSFSGAAEPGTYSLNIPNSIVTKANLFEYKIDGATNVVLTEYGGSGEFIAGSFSANFRERTSNALVAGTCSFRVRRF